MIERTTSAKNGGAAIGGGYTSPSFAIVFGLLTAVLVAVALYFALKDEFIAKRSTSILPSSPTLSVGTQPNSAGPKTK